MQERKRAAYDPRAALRRSASAASLASREERRRIGRPWQGFGRSFRANRRILAHFRAPFGTFQLWHAEIGQAGTCVARGGLAKRSGDLTRDARIDGAFRRRKPCSWRAGQEGSPAAVLELQAHAALARAQLLEHRAHPEARKWLIDSLRASFARPRRKSQVLAPERQVMPDRRKTPSPYRSSWEGLGYGASSFYAFGTPHKRPVSTTSSPYQPSYQSYQSGEESQLKIYSDLFEEAAKSRKLKKLEENGLFQEVLKAL